jgi:hypothetical protein
MTAAIAQLRNVAQRIPAPTAPTANPTRPPAKRTQSNPPRRSPHASKSPRTPQN